ncbi:peptidase inhibitor family I36 protein [Streptomyces sp. NPDC051452]|uniref:peptidase inhibitor family I36 protein n=1 Tax=Streptomyces sp. NPDC051452 TaxID=3365654 RepID=UPI0037AFC869
MPASKFRTTTTGMAMAAGLVLAALTAPMASAAPSTGSASGYDRCASPNFCLFENIDGQGRVLGLQGERKTLPSDFDNITSSLRNRNGRIWSVYTGTNFTGRCLPVAATYKGNVTQYNLNDQISSVRPGPCPS